MRKYEIMYILKADLDEASRKAELDKERMVSQAIYGERGKKVYNALKKYRRNKY